MKKIGIATVGLNETFGPVFTAIVVVNPNFFRKYPNIDEFNRALMEKVVKESVFVFIKKTEGNEVTAETKNIHTAQLLNMFPSFWKEEIYLGDIDPTKLPFSSNLKKKENLKTEKWNLNCGTSQRTYALAYKVAELALIDAHHDIRRIYGDEAISTGEVGIMNKRKTI